MINILLKHVITELALNTLFERLSENFETIEPDNMATVIYVKNKFKMLDNISKDIRYFMSKRDKSHPDYYERYNEMINKLEDAESLYRYVTFKEIAEQNVQKTRRELSRRVKIKD